MENENQNYRENHTVKPQDNVWFGMSPIAVIGIGAVLLAVAFYMYNGGFGSRVATTPVSPITDTSPTTPVTSPKQ